MGVLGQTVRRSAVPAVLMAVLAVSAVPVSAQAALAAPLLARLVDTAALRADGAGVAVGVELTCRSLRLVTVEISLQQATSSGGIVSASLGGAASCGAVTRTVWFPGVGNQTIRFTGVSTAFSPGSAAASLYAVCEDGSCAAGTDQRVLTIQPLVHDQPTGSLVGDSVHLNPSGQVSPDGHTVTLLARAACPVGQGLGLEDVVSQRAASGRRLATMWSNGNLVGPVCDGQEHTVTVQLSDPTQTMRAGVAFVEVQAVDCGAAPPGGQCPAFVLWQQMSLS